jgi:LacI family transcriptional regulator, galactose operon repressor
MRVNPSNPAHSQNVDFGKMDLQTHKGILPVPKSPRATPRITRRPRLTDIAQMCGVSAATVSRVLNQDENFSAREEVRQRIFEAARAIGYAPDLAARNLNRGKTHIIGVFGSPHTHFSEGINDALFQGIGEAIRSRDFDVFFELATREPTSRGLPAWRFDGAILIQSPQPQVMVELDRRRVPYVSVNEIVGNPVAAVLADDVLGTTLAMQHLADLGHKRFAYANALRTYFRHYSVEDRHNTITAYTTEHDLHLVPGHDVQFDAPEQFLREAVHTHHATAVVTYDHRIAIAVLGAAHRLGLRIPDDFSLVCFNDEFPTAVVNPPITAVAVSGEAMGRTAARLLLRVLQSGQSEAPARVRLPETLVVRASTAPPPPSQE